MNVEVKKKWEREIKYDITILIFSSKGVIRFRFIFLL